VAYCGQVLTASVVMMSAANDERTRTMDKLRSTRTPLGTRRRLGRNEVVYRTAGGGTLVVATPSGGPARRWRPRPPRP